MREKFTHCAQVAASLRAGKCLWVSLLVLRLLHRHTHLQTAIEGIDQKRSLAHGHNER